MEILFSNVVEEFKTNVSTIFYFMISALTS